MQFFKVLSADFLKMRRLAVKSAHLIVPVLISIIFLLYYTGNAWSEETQFTAFYEAVGAGYPLVIGVLSAMAAQQEQSAGNYQNLLAYPQRRAVFLSKCVLLAGLGLTAVLLTSAVFGIGFYKFLGNTKFDMTVYVIMALAIWGGGLPLYIWHLLTAFAAGAGVSAGIGLVESLIGFLLLTDMGKWVWKYIPCTWSSRLAQTVTDTNAGFPKGFIGIYAAVVTVSLILYLYWAGRWEGGRRTE